MPRRPACCGGEMIPNPGSDEALKMGCVTNITKIENVKMLPKGEMRCYSLTGNETMESAIEKYEKLYRVPPTRGWLWGSYLYLEV